jgi:hypothetical protein
MGSLRQRRGWVFPPSIRIFKQQPLVIPGRRESGEPGIHSHDREYGFRARAKRARPGMTTENGTHLRLPAARNARAIQQSGAFGKSEGAGNTGCRPHPRALRAKENALCARKQRQVQPEQPAFPAQWFYGLYVLSSVRRLLATVALRYVPQGLIPASGDQDHTISQSAPASHVRRQGSRPPHPTPTPVTI